MKRAFWYEEKKMTATDMLQDVEESETSALSFLKHYNNISVTENGATGYRTSGSALLDLNFKVASLRDRDETDITDELIKAWHESPEYALKWLFFLRDIECGLGERRTFRVGLTYLAVSHPEIARAVMKLIPEYGRYDDLLAYLDTPMDGEAAEFLHGQLQADLQAMREGKSVTLLAKWLPSINTSSEKTKRYARKLSRLWKMTPRQYRQTLSQLRAYMDVLETKISSSRWSEVDYEKVPAKAGMVYEAAFERHDLDRRKAYFGKVLQGDGKLSAKGVMPYEITRRLTRRDSSYCGFRGLQDDFLAELMWQKLLEDGMAQNWGLEDAIVVADGSGSMFTPVSGGGIFHAMGSRSGKSSARCQLMAIDVCNSLAIYFAQQLQGVFHNKAITFSGRPQFIDLKEETSLKDKLEIMYAHNECANTNIEAVFDLILAMAQEQKVPREQLPKQVLIISDMEFDMASQAPYYGWNLQHAKQDWHKADARLFDLIRRKYEAAGYVMPRLIFWNLCGRSDTIPMVENGEGLCLLSGFSQNAMKVAADQTVKDPYAALIKLLDSPRYQPVWEATRKLAA